MCTQGSSCRLLPARSLKFYNPFPFRPPPASSCPQQGIPRFQAPTSADQAHTNVQSACTAALVMSPSGRTASSTSTCTSSTVRRYARCSSFMRYRMYSGCSMWYLQVKECTYIHACMRHAHTNCNTVTQIRPSLTLAAQQMQMLHAHL